ncbi:PIN domain-containing protein [Haloglycomyces albus]|uniref:PIN domain-containing protein n=1 Tax=Haloglycomyces albus TaxID=526067 RepID=UPI000685861E|nr:PIN domain-containing protein [Haloglycomyces albus]
MATLILDTSGILAAFDEDDPVHRMVSEVLSDPRHTLVLSPFIVAESDYMLAKRLGAEAALKFSEYVSAGVFDLATWTGDDHQAAHEIISRSKIDRDYVGVADASLVVLADAYRTTTLVTKDVRHFRELKPIWGADHFTLYPADL